MKIKQINNAKCSNRKGHILACFVAVLFCAVSFAFTLPVFAAEFDFDSQENSCSVHAPGGMEYLQCIYNVAAHMPKFDPEKRENFGESYDRQKYIECMLKGRESGHNLTGKCKVYRLTRNENPEYWPYADVPAVKWPEAPNLPTYKEGMSSEEYFKALCETEAGEFIYKTVDEVEGFYEIRPRVEESDYALSDRYVVEDPFGYVMGSTGLASTDYYVQPYGGKYNFWETRGKYIKKYSTIPPKYTGTLNNLFSIYYRDLKNIKSKQTIQTAKNGKFYRVPLIVTEEPVKELKSNYGYIWRGISRPHDRELGIAGGELIIIDLKTNEIVAVRRGFARSGYKKSQTGFWWLAPKICPIFKDKSEHSFIESVLKPTQENLDFEFSKMEGNK